MVRSQRYRIRLQGRLSHRWSKWFDGLTLTTNGDETELVGVVLDQAALHGLLRKIRDLGMPLIEVYRLDSPETTEKNRRKS